MTIEMWRNPTFSQDYYGVIVNESGTPVKVSQLSSESQLNKFEADPAGYMARNGADDYELDEVLEMVGSARTTRRPVA